jgi:hypothetical protein
MGTREVHVRVQSILLSWCLEILGRLLLFNHVCILESYIIGKYIVYTNHLNPNPWEKNRIEKEQMRYIASKPFLLHSGCEIPTYVFC